LQKETQNSFFQKVILYTSNRFFTAILWNIQLKFIHECHTGYWTKIWKKITYDKLG